MDGTWYKVLDPISEHRLWAYTASTVTAPIDLFCVEGFISPEILIYFFSNSDSNLTQTQMLTLKLFPNRTLTQTLT